MLRGVCRRHEHHLHACTGRLKKQPLLDRPSHPFAQHIAHLLAVFAVHHKAMRQVFKYVRLRLGGADFLRPLIERAAKTAPGAAAFSKVFKPAAADPSVKFVDMLAACGFPSPALDYAAKEMSLNDYFVKHQDATYIVEAQGDSMIDAGICEGDILIVDRSVEPRSGDIVLAFLHGDFTIKRLVIADGVPELHPENHTGVYPVIRPGEFDTWAESFAAKCF